MDNLFSGHDDKQALKFINSITKYPSISTYHPMDLKTGKLQPGPVQFTEEIYVTEKIDGTNARILLTPLGYMIGSRENLLTYEGDLLFDPAQGIVEGLRTIAGNIDNVTLDFGSPLEIIVVYGEFYGGNTSKGAKQYTQTQETGFRIFDIALFTTQLFDELQTYSPEQISGWRERMNQPFVDHYELLDYIRDLQVEASVVPSLGSLSPTDMPQKLFETKQWLQNIITGTAAGLDEHSLRNGKPEGIVIRNKNRSQISKLRFDDYRRVTVDE